MTTYEPASSFWGVAPLANKLRRDGYELFIERGLDDLGICGFSWSIYQRGRRVATARTPERSRQRAVKAAHDHIYRKWK